MYNEKQTYNSNDLIEKSINELINKEKTIKEINLAGAEFSFDSKNKDIPFSSFRGKLYIKINDIICYHVWDEKLVYQLGMRIWSGDKRIDEKDFVPYKSKKEDLPLIHKKISEITVREFENLFSFLRKHYKLICYCFEENNNRFHIYGIVSDEFQRLNQNVFREKFIQECLKEDIKLNFNTSKQYYHKKFDSYIEIISLDIEEKAQDKCNISLMLSYGKNNGNKSYTFYWILSLKTGEEIYYVSSKHNWRNCPFDIKQGNTFDNFITNLITEGTFFIERTEDNIRDLNKTILTKKAEENLNDVLEQVKVSYATKSRIIDEFRKLQVKDINTEWSITYPLITYGHKAHKDTSYKMANLIKLASIEILNYGLEKALSIWKKQGGIKVTYHNYEVKEKSLY